MTPELNEAYYLEWVNMVFGGYMAPMTVQMMIAVQQLAARVEALV